MNDDNPQLNCLTCNARATSIFSETTTGDLAVLSDSKTCRHLKRGDIVYSEGAVPHGVFCIHQGTVKILRTGESGREGILRLVKEGGVLGYRSLLSGEEYDNTAVALEDSRICFIPRSHFVDLISKRPELSSKVLALLSNELKNAEERLIDVAQKPLIERVAESLLLLLQSFGYADDQQTIDLDITREELAGIVGAVPESTIRALSKLKSEGLIDVRRRHISILDRRGLADVANLPV